MSYLDEIKSICSDYLVTAEKVYKEARPLAGIFGIGNGPKNDPCHLKFYQDLEAKAKELADSDVPEEEKYEATCYILHLDETDCNETMRFMLTAAQGVTKDLIPVLSREHKDELAAWFNKAVPKRMRLPVQNDIFKLMTK